MSEKADIEVVRRKLSAMRAAAQARRDAGEPGRGEDEAAMQRDLEAQGLTADEARSIVQSRAWRVMHQLPPERPDS